jgi:YD repeat-containing protein
VSKRILFFVFAAIVLQGVWDLDASAQSFPVVPDKCIGTTRYFFTDVRRPGSFFCKPYLTYMYACRSMTPVCPPAKPCDHCAKSNAPDFKGSRPIDLSSGNTYIDEVDVSLPGLGGGLSLARRYNSAPTQECVLTVVVSVSTRASDSSGDGGGGGETYQCTPIGPGIFGSTWRSTYEERIIWGSDFYMKYLRSDGSYWSFGDTGTNYNLVAPANTSATLAYYFTYWTLTFQNGEKRVFDAVTGNLTAIIDRNGNTTQIAYDASGRLSTVTDPTSRHLTFTYGSPTSQLVTGVSSDVGLSLTYAYDTSFRLSTVTKPDLSTVNFTYSGSTALITQVTDSNGKVLESHTYDSNGRGTSGSRAGGIESVTVTYQ